MVDADRIKKQFLKLSMFDSESFEEKYIAEYMVYKLRKLGLKVNTSSTTDKAYLKAHPSSHPNIYAVLEGDPQKEPVLFSSHLDTVSPGWDKKPIVTDDGFITSSGDTVLGADDISGLVSIIEALNVIKEEGRPHPDIEILITVAEEPFCEGSKYFDFGLVKSKNAYVLDLTGPIGTAATKAPSIISFEITIKGKASHAGFAPEEGINALLIASEAISKIQIGRVDPYTTVNIGTIEGGAGKNIVPETIRLTGEVRSTDHNKAEESIKKIFDIFGVTAKNAGGACSFNKTTHILAYSVDKNESVVKRFEKACEKTGLTPGTIATFGGSDANRLNAAGIPTIVYACGMEKVHSTEEYTYIPDLKRSAELTLNLMTT